MMGADPPEQATPRRGAKGSARRSQARRTAIRPHTWLTPANGASVSALKRRYRFSHAGCRGLAPGGGEPLATARRWRNKPRHLDTRTVDLRSVDVGKQPAVRPDLPSNRGPTLAWSKDPCCGQLECPVRADFSS